MTIYRWGILKHLAHNDFCLKSCNQSRFQACFWLLVTFNTSNELKSQLHPHAVNLTSPCTKQNFYGQIVYIHNVSAPALILLLHSFTLPDNKVNVMAWTGMADPPSSSLMSFMLTCILTCLWNMVGVVVAPRLYSSRNESGESTLCWRSVIWKKNRYDNFN